MAEVGAIYDTTLIGRIPADILAPDDTEAATPRMDRPYVTGG
jgi:hypothetical protein